MDAENRTHLIDLSEIKRQAQTLLLSSGLLGKCPFDLTKLISYLGYKVRLFTPEEKDSNISGTVSKYYKTILLNRREPYTRQRFTLAHEIGHIFLHFNKTDEEFVDYNRGNKKTLEEAEADEFAACILMPEEDFIKSWNQSDGDYAYMANSFGVSYAAIGMRAYRLGLQ